VKKLLPLLFILILTGCQKNDAEKIKQPLPLCFDLEEIISRGRIIALTDESSSSYFVYKGTPIGFEYDLLKRFAKHIGVQLEMKVVKDLYCRYARKWRGRCNCR